MTEPRGKSEIARRVFLVGCPRSGTTLLQSLLAAHSQITSFPETHAFALMVPRRPWLRRMGLMRPRGRGRLKRLGQELGIESPAGLAGWFYRPAIRRLVEALDGLALARGAAVWVEKTPRHLHDLGVIARTVPKAGFLHLVREGSAVARSLFEASRSAPGEWGGARSLRACAERWVEDLRISAGHAGRPGHSLVVYEDLVADPARALARLCRELGLPFEEAMLSGHREAAAALIRPEETWKQGATRPIGEPGTAYPPLDPAAARQLEAWLAPGEELYRELRRRYSGSGEGEPAASQR